MIVRLDPRTRHDDLVLLCRGPLTVRRVRWLTYANLEAVRLEPYSISVVAVGADGHKDVIAGPLEVAPGERPDPSGHVPLAQPVIFIPRGVPLYAVIEGDPPDGQLVIGDEVEHFAA